jgi:hypothetical protein
VAMFGQTRPVLRAEAVDADGPESPSGGG